jgi:hypothetical protein
MPDMRELLEVARADGPPPRYTVDDIVAAGRRHRRWVRTLRVGGAAAAVAAVTAGVLLAGSAVLPRTGGTGSPGSAGNGGLARPVAPVAPPAAAAQPPPFTFMITAYRVGAFRVLPPQEITPTYQRASILAGQPTAQAGHPTSYLGRLTLYRPGVRPAVASGASLLTVQGRPAYLAQGTRRVLDGVTSHFRVMPSSAPQTVYTLTWQYADDAWAVIASEPNFANEAMSPATEVSIANAFHAGAPVPARIPFRASYLPAGWHVSAIMGQSFAAEDVGSVSVTYTRPAASQNPPAKAPSIVVTIGQLDTPPPDAPKHKPTCSTTQSFCSWRIPGTGFYLLVEDPSNTLPTTELLRIGQSLVFDNLTKPATWHPVA